MPFDQPHFIGVIKMKTYFWITLFLQSVLADVYYVKLHQNHQENCLILKQKSLHKFKGFQTTDENELKVYLKPAITAPAESMLQIEDNSKIIEIYAKKENILEAHINTFCRRKQSLAPLHNSKADGPEIELIVDGGSQENRIDYVFMGDGYTIDEREEFFDDIHRLTNEMFSGNTFRSYLPLFNIWAAYVESEESGIGYLQPRNTAFRLYRTLGYLRGIYTANAQLARQICRSIGTNGCDYPSIIANDNYYGGIGGEIVISTKSQRSGTVVLRHEMGHTFTDAGDEYDNGEHYYGVNSASTLPVANSKWEHWLTGDTARHERAMYRLLEYPWADLSSLSPESFNFTSDGLYSRWYLQVSVSAAGEDDSLEFMLDGVILPWETRGFDDREFYSWSGDQGFSSGDHTLSVRSKTLPTNDDVPRMICSITLHELGNEDEFKIDNGYVSAYPIWDLYREITYRPTNAGCLMRNMTHTEFCSVCKEGIWNQLLQRISLIDGVNVSKITNPNRTKTITLKTLKLGQLREPGNRIDGERLEVRWSHGENDHPEFDDQFEINAGIGSWSVSVRLITPEVRSDPNGLLHEVEKFTVTLPVNSTVIEGPLGDF